MPVWFVVLRFSFYPSEGLLNPPVFLGVLRALSRHENESPSSPALTKDLAIVQSQTQTKVNLLPDKNDPDRNLIRAAGQYWKGMGVLRPDKGVIHLSPLGHMMAEGGVTQGEFAAMVVQQTVLPNPSIFSEQEMATWKSAGLEIRPLALILEILNALASDYGGINSAYITPWELIRICIPLAGVKAKAGLMASAIAAHRLGKLDVSTWPDCVPAANDHRCAKEFLRFLANFGICRHIKKKNAMDDIYRLDELFDKEALVAKSQTSILIDPTHTDAVLKEIRQSALPSIIERQRILASVLARHGQSKFREDVLKAYSRRCLFTGESIGEVLEAAHIIPVGNGGGDKSDNGICLRVDIHRLFDSNNTGRPPHH